ncbi:hypothetical protein N7512_010233 [Penicillium capsulatum]|nr:hypothetical protein N7512_010233 [Penicillium capsulatum]
MVCHSFAPLVILVAALLVLQTQCKPVRFQKRGFCATENPDATFLDAVHNVKIDENHPQPGGSEARKGPIEIETWFHIVSSKSEENQVSDNMVDDQLAILQNSYNDAAIKFRLQGVTRHVNDLWARNGDDIAMKKALRLPGQSGRAEHRALGVASDLASSVLGFCTLPDPNVNATSTPADYIKDGCNILANTMPGGSLDLYNRGGTAIHEIGHWNGLLHTFQGESCSADNPGDYIADTPQQSTPTDGCPDRKDSCPDSPGLDAIHDFMDYSSDVCYESFTAGQTQRMRNMWASMREGK